MTVGRRHFLRGLGFVMVGSLAGCAGNDSSPANDASPSDESPTSTPSDTLTPTPEPDPSPDPNPEDASYTAKLLAGNGDGNDFFGEAVSISQDGTTALVGAYTDDNPNGQSAGSAYVFSKSGGSWTQQAKLTAADGNANDLFGAAVALAPDGTTAVIGAPWEEDSNGKFAGAAYVFSQENNSWTQDAKLVSPAGSSGDEMGWSVDIAADGETVVAGAPGDDEYEGAAYVFSGADGSWVNSALLAAVNSDVAQEFGTSVAMAADGSTVLVGAYRQANTDQPGAAYVYSNAGGSWHQQAKLTDADEATTEAFGTSVGLSADGATALVGVAGDHEPNGADAGAAILFARDGESWTRHTKLAPTDGDSADKFGTTVTLADEGATALITAPGDEDPNGSKAGSAYLFSQSNDSWTQTDKLVPTDGESDDRFGNAAAIDGDGSVALIAAASDDTSNGTQSGSAYVFNLSHQDE